MSAKNTLTTGNTSLYLGIAVLLGVGAYFVYNKNSGNNDYSEPSDEPSTTPAVAANYDLLLSKGSKGLEVGKLQILLGITSDGIFGPNTEAKLYEVKGVKQITLNQWPKLPTLVKVKIIPVNTKVMANLPTVSIYSAYRKADGSIYTKGEVKETVPYGTDLGIIKSGINVNGLYVIYHNKFEWTNPDAPVYEIGMVRGSDIIKQ